MMPNYLPYAITVCHDSRGSVKQNMATLKLHPLIEQHQQIHVNRFFKKVQ